MSDAGTQLGGQAACPPEPSEPVRPPPSAIGALAAAVQASEFARLLDPQRRPARAVEELFFDLPSRRHLVTVFPRRAGCRFDHRRWNPVPVPAGAGLEWLATQGAAGAKLSVGGDAFVAEWNCRGCGRRRSGWHLFMRGRWSPPSCSACGAALTAGASEVREELEIGELLAAVPSGGSLHSLGLRPADVFALDERADRRHFVLEQATETAGEARRPAVAIVGCGNIGSHLVPHLARTQGVERILLIDPDHYGGENLAGQAIARSDLGRAKVAVQAERIRAIAPRLTVVPLDVPIERVPLGLMAGAVLLGCVDSRAARQSINECAWRVGRGWIDAAVDQDAQLCRVVAYPCDAEAPCIECGWEDEDYAQLETAHPCQEERLGAPSSESDRLEQRATENVEFGADLPKNHSGRQAPE